MPSNELKHNVSQDMRDMIIRMVTHEGKSQREVSTLTHMPRTTISNIVRRFLNTDDTTPGKKGKDRETQIQLRALVGSWIFRGLERGTGRFLVLQIRDRSAEKLCPPIHYWILPGTTTISDKRRSYRDINNQGFERLTVNHSVNFEDPATGAHTYNIERIWKDVRTSIPLHELTKIHSS
ncbi:hypothetical protein RF11_02069 [Thelohanellus kitauei]|uniref:ISXO2-like transposase domain-containing protein n=1 Tax=Thelohanellus kitauei TaxID=669202 RepID=A0A0C2MQ01_THEKT|nr:hypothetical protein RF11_02069 [Thelohanellus kitauei]